MKLQDEERKLYHRQAIALKYNPNPFAMNTLQIRGSWKQVQGKLKQKYAQLTGNDLLFTEGKEDEMLGRLEKRIGKSKEEIKREI